MAEHVSKRPLATSPASNPKGKEEEDATTAPAAKPKRKKAAKKKA